MTGTARDLVRDAIAAGLLAAGEELGWGDQARAVAVEVERPAEKAHGDYAANIAMRLAKPLRTPPLEIAKAIARRVPQRDEIASVEAAPPGFINVRLAPAWLARQVEAIARAGAAFGRNDALKGQKIQVEFVSANPTGPVTVANARGGPIGDVLANVLELSGATVEREYYVNDAGTQLEVFGRSVAVRYLELGGKTGLAIPEDGYPAEYVIDLARRLRDRHGAAFDDQRPEELAERFAREALDTVVEWHRVSMRKFGITFDSFYRESAMVASPYFQQTMEALRAADAIEERDGAVWLKSRELGEDIDSVLVRSTGARVPTYIGVDIAYHREALVERGFDVKIDVWGANTHGHARRMKTAMVALGLEGRWKLVLYQFVKFLHEGVLVNMARRRGQFVLLDDVVDTVGKDVTRWFFLMASADRTLDFDLELAVQQSNENPAYYVQYAHARIASIFRTAAERGLVTEGSDVSRLTDEAELDLVRLMLRFPELVAEIRDKHNVHLLTGYGLELAGAFHAFYKGNRVVGDDEARSKARLRLVEAVGVTLRQTLG
ncbi:MAG TPA: arginine--tRNA ligase, partial [Candidatus Limnocylindria bacterium]|nr:arginine--tRNA ligase [Candidatus Limnocylindria bacterium]